MKNCKFYFKQPIMVLFIIVVPFFYSCSDKLTREEAEKSINIDFPKIETFKMKIGYNAPEQQAYLYNSIEGLGLISVKWWTNYWGEKLGIDFIEITEEGRRYIVSNDNDYATFKTAELDFGEITGIIENEELNNAEVQYTLIRKNVTPFGKAKNLLEGKVSKSALFTKYDDGWRITKNAQNEE